jgi:hypothetical protein
MRMNFTAQSSSHGSGMVSVRIRPACGVPGEFFFSTNRRSLLRLLRRATELRSAALERFEIELAVAKKATLRGVETSDSVLVQIGYFID